MTLQKEISKMPRILTETFIRFVMMLIIPIVSIIFFLFYFFYFLPTIYNLGIEYKMNYPNDYVKGIEIPKGVKIKFLLGEPKTIFSFDNNKGIHTVGYYESMRKIIWIDINNSNLDNVRKTIRHELYHWEFNNNLSKEEIKNIKRDWNMYCNSPTEFYAGTMIKDLEIN